MHLLLLPFRRVPSSGQGSKPISASNGCKCAWARGSIGTGGGGGGGGHVVAYASRILTKAEANYSVIQQECLAVVYGIRQFRHYLLGRSFQLWTDHKPLQWLSEQRMEGMLCRWALALQEYNFTVEYRKGSHNDNADVPCPDVGRL